MRIPIKTTDEPQENTGYFYIIPAKIVEDPDIPPKGKWLFGLLASMADQTGSCYASNGWLAQKLNLKDKDYVSTLLSKLFKKDWLVTDTDKKTGKRFILLNFSKPYSKNFKGGLEKFQEGTRKISSGSEPNLGTPSNNISNNTSKDIYLPENLLDLPEEKVKELPDVFRVYRYYLICFKRTQNQVKLTDTRKSKILARLKSYSLEEVIQAVKNTSRSPWHLGQNNTGWKANLDFIIRSDEQIEKLRDLSPKREDEKVLVKFDDGTEAWVDKDG